MEMGEMESEKHSRARDDAYNVLDTLAMPRRRPPPSRPGRTPCCSQLALLAGAACERSQRDDEDNGRAGVRERRVAPGFVWVLSDDLQM